MSLIKWIVAITLLEFSVFTVYAVSQIDGLQSLQAAFTGDWMVMQVFIDLVLCLVLIAAWTWQDARRRGINPVPYIVLYCFTGSIGVMIYLLRHVLNKPRPAEGVIAPKAQLS